METLDIEKIMEILPHRFPFLLVDRILELQDGPKPGSRVGRKVVGIKNVTYNEPFFPGHFPGRAVMPGVLILEAMAQVGAIGHHLDLEPEAFMIAGVDRARFKRPVIPGDTLVISCEYMVDKGSMKKIDCVVKVDGQLVAEASIWAYSEPR